MKNLSLVILWLLVCLIIILPISKIMLSVFDYSLEFISYPGFAVFTALLSLAATGLLFIVKEMPQSTALSVFSAILPFFAFLNSGIYLLNSTNHITIVSMVVTVFCSFVICIRHSHLAVLKVISLILASLAVIPMIFLTFIVFTFGRIATVTVVDTVYSPDGAYYVEVIDSDQGALGGDTFVELYEKSAVDLFFIRISKKPERIYHGDWGAYKKLDIYWKDENTVVIGSSEYYVQ